MVARSTDGTASLDVWNFRAGKHVSKIYSTMPLDLTSRTCKKRSLQLVEKR
jgi:hypothetical protein